MGKGSTLARVIGLTRSFSPFERNEVEGPGAPADGVAETGSTKAANETADAAGPAVASVVVALPALAQVTTVATETSAPPDAAREAVTTSAIDAIEADIASLLASLDTVSDLRLPAAMDDEDEAFADGDIEQATLVLLSELDRMWRADPATGRSFR